MWCDQNIINIPCASVMKPPLQAQLTQRTVTLTGLTHVVTASTSPLMFRIKHVVKQVETFSVAALKQVAVAEPY